MNIAIDCMGGDNAPAMIVDALNLIISKGCNDIALHFLLYGVKSKIAPLIQKYDNLQIYITVIDVKIYILSTDQPSMALRRRKGSSMHLAIESVLNKSADCVISAGNTGALMAIARFTLGMLPNINRPAIVCAVPSKERDMALLDLGANVDCDANTLYQFAVMGRAFAKSVFNKKNPSVALLNVGAEEVKGTESVKGAYNLLKNSKLNINFIGYTEADQIFCEGGCDVVVVDGFCGNIMLKTTEGIYKLLKFSMKKTFKSSIIGLLSGFLLKCLMKKALKRFEPKLRNGAMLIGLNGIVIKSHGNADAESFANAISVAIHAVKNKINHQITKELWSTK